MTRRKSRAFEVALALIQAREIAKQIRVPPVRVREVVVPPPEVRIEIKPPKPMPSHVVDWRDIMVTGEQVVVERSGYGVLEEFMIKAEDPEFQVLVVRDWELKPILRGNYSDIRDIQQNVQSLSAFPERNEEGDLTGCYVVSIRDVQFEKNLVIRLSTEKPVKFGAVYAKYKLSHV